MFTAESMEVTAISTIFVCMAVYSSLKETVVTEAPSASYSALVISPPPSRTFLPLKPSIVRMESPLLMKYCSPPNMTLTTFRPSALIFSYRGRAYSEV